MKRLVVLAVKAAVTVGAFYWLSRQIQLGPALQTVLEARPGPAAAGFAILIIQAVAGALRWRQIIRLQGGDLGLGDALRLFFLGTFVNQTLSSTVGGDAVRVWRLTAVGSDWKMATGTVVLERVAGLLSLGAIAVLALPLVSGPVRLGVWVLIAASAAALAVLLVGGREPRMPGGWVRLLLVSRRVLVSRGGAPVFAMSVAIHLLGGLALWFVGMALGTDLPLVACLVVVPPVLLIATLPISLGGWGIREGAMVAVWGTLGIAADQMLAVSVAFGLLVMLSGLLGLFVWLGPAKAG